MQIDTRTY